jgi:hypothetical protein
VRLDDEHLVPLTTSDLMTLRAGLTAYLREFARHRAEDGAASHPEEEWEAMKREVGQLLWRLEEAGLPPGSDIEHSDEAVRPDRR